MLTRLASFSFRHRWMMLGAWVLTLVLAVLAAGSFAGDYSNGDNLEGSDSTKAYELRNDEFPSDDNGSSAEMAPELRSTRSSPNLRNCPG
jgi:uncharacterized membrane protein YdfJ with MMPL/SSD domain